MARKRRKPPIIGKPRPTPSPSKKGKGAGGDSPRPKSGVSFELEADAESLFLKEFEGLGFWDEGISDGDAFDDWADSEPWLKPKKKPGAKGSGAKGSKGSGGAKSTKGSNGSKGTGKKGAALASTEIDLHHHTKDEAEQALNRLILELKAKHKRVKLRIITGKGHRSKDGKGVLVRTIHSFVSDRFSQAIETIQPCPSASTIDGQPIRGYFDVVFKF